jgi:hypothetical protein
VRPHFVALPLVCGIFICTPKVGRPRDILSFVKHDMEGRCEMRLLATCSPEVLVLHQKACGAWWRDTWAEDSVQVEVWMWTALSVCVLIFCLSDCKVESKKRIITIIHSS